MSTIKVTNLKHESSGSNNIVLDSSANATVAGNLTVSGTGNQSIAGTLQFNSGYGSVATAYGCRAWVRFNGDGTVGIAGSGNVSSITDRATGKYVVNFANAHSDANYSFAGATSPASNGDPNHLYMDNTWGQADNTLGIATARGQDGALQDAQNVYVATFR